MTSNITNFEGKRAGRYVGTAQRRIDGAAGQPGDVDDVESVAISIGDRLKDDGGRVGEKGSGHEVTGSVASKLSRQYSTYHLTQGACKCSVRARGQVAREVGARPVACQG